MDLSVGQLELFKLFCIPRYLHERSALLIQLFWLCGPENFLCEEPWVSDTCMKICSLYLVIEDVWSRVFLRETLAVILLSENMLRH